MTKKSSLKGHALWSAVLQFSRFGGNAVIFINTPSLLIVGGGTAAVILMKFPVGEVINSVRERSSIVRATHPPNPEGNSKPGRKLW